MTIDIYMYFEGNARDAVDFYSEVFEVKKNEIMTYGDQPTDSNVKMSESERKLIMHTDLVIDGTSLMFSDISTLMTSQPVTKGNAISLVISNDNKMYIKNIFDKLKIGGKVEMELEETFYSKLYGRVQDKFSNTWEIMYTGE